MIRYYLCVDDTDDLTKKTSTGKIAEHIKKEAESLGSVIDYGITRHQLLLDDAIAYTSHNSSMCFSGSLSEDQLSRLWEKAAEIIMAEKAETADPGLCLCRLCLLYTSGCALLPIQITVRCWTSPNPF